MDDKLTDILRAYAAAICDHVYHSQFTDEMDNVSYYKGKVDGLEEAYLVCLGTKKPIHHHPYARNGYILQAISILGEGLYSRATGRSDSEGRSVIYWAIVDPRGKSMNQDAEPPNPYDDSWIFLDPARRK